MPTMVSTTFKITLSANRGLVLTACYPHFLASNLRPATNIMVAANVPPGSVEMTAQSQVRLCVFKLDMR